MPGLPTGTITLLFTDIEGSTRLQQQLGQSYSGVLSECRHQLRESFHQWHGHEVDTQGDAFLAAFARASDALGASVDAQRALAALAWPAGVTVGVRMGVHTGEPILSAEGYIGLDVHRAARILSAGHSGQVLLSQTTRDLVEHDLPGGVSLRDLGSHRLKDLQHPSHLYQLVIEGLPADFLPLRTLDTYPNNLPVQPTSFLGREQVVAGVQDLLSRENVRLLTLTGPGGIGKTRVGLQVAADLADRFADGVYFVNLALISDPTLVLSTIAQTLDLKESEEQAMLDLLKTSLRKKHLLLLLDNFEQVTSAASQVADLLAACPNLKVIVTSRAVLHVRGEQEFAVPPLAVPNPIHLPDLVALSQYEAVALFISRAQAVKPEFQVSNANAPAVAEICVRLDGLPLAIELAAARIKLLPPQALLARLGWGLAILTNKAPDVPARQRTLRNTIEWSYYLLDAHEQRLFRRLSVFVGGCTLEAIEAVCAAFHDGTGQVLEGVASLLDKSLLQQAEQEGGEPRLTMLETVREYGLECLREGREVEVSQRAHALYYLVLAEEAEPLLKGPQQVVGLRRLEREQGNLRAALEWLIEYKETDLAFRISGALLRFWDIRGYWSEGRRWLEAVLGLPQVYKRTVVQAKVLCGAGMLAYLQGDAVGARSLCEASVDLYRELAEKQGLAEALGYLGWSMYQHNDAAAASTMLEESITLAHEVGDRWTVAFSLQRLGNLTLDHGDFEGAHLLLEESMALSRELGDKQHLSRTLTMLVKVLIAQGGMIQAAMLAQESLVLARELDNRPAIAGALYWLAVTKSYQGEYAQALVLCEESLALSREMGNKIQVASVLLALADLALIENNLVRAATLAQESLLLYRELGVKRSIALVLSCLGMVRRAQGELAQATGLFNEGLSLAGEVRDSYSIGWNLIGLAKVATLAGQYERAACLFGAADPWFNPDVDMGPFEHADYERAVERVREGLGEKAFATAWAEGRTMTPEQVLAAPPPIRELISSEPSSTPSAKSPPLYPDGLTAREVEVLRLVAQGLSDTQVAAQLIISPRTVNTHLTSIYGKIGVTSRAAATRYAMEHRLV